MDGPALSCEQPVGPLRPSWYLCLAGFRAGLCPKSSPVVAFTGSFAKKLPNLTMFSVKESAIFPVSFTYCVWQPEVTPDLPLFSHFPGVCCRSPPCSVSPSQGFVLLAVTAQGQCPSGHLCHPHSLYQQSDALSVCRDGSCLDGDLP